MKKILPSTPNRLTENPQCLSSSCSMLELTPLALHTVSVPQRGGVGPPMELLCLWHSAPEEKSPPASLYSVSFTCTSERWEFTFHGAILQHLPELKQLSCMYPVVLSSCSSTGNLKGSET